MGRDAQVSIMTSDRFKNGAGRCQEATHERCGACDAQLSIAAELGATTLQVGRQAAPRTLQPGVGQHVRGRKAAILLA